MATQKQSEAARENIKEAQKQWQSMSHHEHALAQPQGRNRARVGAKGEGDYFRVEVRPKGEFVTFRYQDVGKPGEILRLAGKRSSGSWDDQAWLIGKKMAHISGDKLVGDKPDAISVLDKIGPAKHIKGDVFEGHPRYNVPEREKPTDKQERARMENIQKAQASRWAQKAKS